MDLGMHFVVLQVVDIPTLLGRARTKPIGVSVTSAELNP